MNYESVEVKISRQQLQRMISDHIAKDFPKHVMDTSFIDADGNVVVKLKEPEKSFIPR